MPWYADHDSDPERQYESFLVNDLVPWVQANLSVTGQEEHWLVGFSKSGFGAVTLLFRNPSSFSAAAAWDFPAEQPDTSVLDMLDNYGTDTNFQHNYRLTDAWIAARKAPFQTARGSGSPTTSGTFSDTRRSWTRCPCSRHDLQANGVQFLRTGGATRPHSWTSGWLPKRWSCLQSMRYTAGDNFNRADGASARTGRRIRRGEPECRSPATRRARAVRWRRTFLECRAFRSRPVLADQDQGAIGDWVGVSVRGRSRRARGTGWRSRPTAPTSTPSSMACSTSSRTTGPAGPPETPSARSSHHRDEYGSPDGLSEWKPTVHVRRRRSLHREWPARHRPLRHDRHLAR